VAKHASPEDCWIVVNGKVYDLTKFAPDHPGGASSVFLTKLNTSDYLLTTPDSVVSVCW
jgi:cytochrome b involved in lipid metabolism